jgi:hypothetical protein
VKCGVGSDQSKHHTSRCFPCLLPLFQMPCAAAAEVQAGAAPAHFEKQQLQHLGGKVVC